MENRTQLALSFAAVAGVYWLYKEGQKILANPTTNMSGIPADWKLDPIVNRSKKTEQQPGQVYPACQTWNDTFQVFLNVSDDDAMKSINTCFTNYTDDENPRYLTDGNSDPIYQRKDPLKEPGSEAGTCYFMTGANEYSFPDVSDSLDGMPLNPVNRSKRLCFASGTSEATAGHRFVKRSDPKTSYYNPGFVLSGLTDTPRCESYQEFESNAFAWVASTAQMTQTQCLAQTGNPVRWNNGAEYIFTNPNNSEMVELQVGIY